MDFVWFDVKVLDYVFDEIDYFVKVWFCDIFGGI